MNVARMSNNISSCHTASVDVSVYLLKFKCRCGDVSTRQLTYLLNYFSAFADVSVVSIKRVYRRVFKCY